MTSPFPFSQVLAASRSALAALALLGLAATTGCASKASEAECQSACDNVETIGMAELEAKIAQDEDLQDAGETGRELVKKQAEALLTAIKDSCMSECSAKGTQKQAECLTKATTSSDLANCK